MAGVPKGTKKKILKKKGTKKKGAGTGRRSKADQVQAQGAGRAVTKAFDTRKKACHTLAGWDAFSPHHTPLPRSVGPYTVIRTTQLISTSDKVVIIGVSQSENVDFPGHVPSWSTGCMFSSENENLAINSATNCNFRTVPFPGSNASAGSGITCTPSAISVQIMNQHALTSTEGIIAAAVCPAQLDLRGRAETWTQFADQFVSYMRPRLMSAGKLALRGVQMDAYPLDMNALSEFRGVANNNDHTASNAFTWNRTNPYSPKGWTPMVVYNKNGLVLDYMVTIEWRVRFDIGNPAVASHVNHPVTPDHVWDNLVQSASSRGPGVMDIVERVANTGTAVANFAESGARAYGAIAALL